MKKMYRKQHTSEKKLTERGWQDMRRLLDLEMPAESRRRFGWWVWALALLAPLAIVGGWVYFSSAGPVKQPQPAPAPAVTPAPAKVPVAAVPAGTPPATPSSHSGSNPASAGVSIAKEAPGAPRLSARQPLTASAPVRTSKNETNTVSDTPLSVPATPSVSEKTAPHAAEVFQTTAAQTPLSEAAPTTDPQNATTAPVAGGVSAQTPSVTNPENGPAAPANPMENPAPLRAVEWPALSPLALRPARLSVQHSMPEATPAVAFIRKNPSHKTWQFGAGIGALATGSLTYTGVTAALTADWQPLRKWGLRSGLSYQYLSYPKQEPNILTFSADSYYKFTGDDKIFGSPVGPGTASTQPVYVPVTEAHRLEIPLLVTWQPMRHWRLLAGASVGKILQADAGNRSLSNNAVFLVAAGQPQRNLNQSVTTQVNSWDTRWNVGIGYRPLRQLEIGLSYQRSFAQRRQLNSFGSVSTTQDPVIVEDIIAAESAVSRARVVRNELFSLMGTWFF